VDAVKLFVSQAIASIISSIFLIIGASILLLLIDWRLALGVLAMLPIIGVTFSVVLGKVRQLFKKGQEAIDWLNKVINESILGGALIRLVNSQHYEYEKFIAANSEARSISLSILRLFASLIPVIIFCTNLATLMILTLGGRFVHTVTEAAKLAFADREAWYADPNFIDVPMTSLLGDAYNAERRKLIGESASFELRPSNDQLLLLLLFEVIVTVSPSCENFTGLSFKNVSSADLLFRPTFRQTSTSTSLVPFVPTSMPPKSTSTTIVPPGFTLNFLLICSSVPACPANGNAISPQSPSKYAELVRFSLFIISDFFT